MRQIVIMAGAAIIKDGKLLVAKRSEHEQYLSGYWTGIGGKLEDEDTTVAAAAVREAKEETGLDVKVIRPLMVKEFTREDRPGVLAVEITFLCEVAKADDLTSSGEHSELRWISQEELVGLDPITDFGRNNLNDIFDEYLKSKQ